MFARILSIVVLAALPFVAACDDDDDDDDFDNRTFVSLLPGEGADVTLEIKVDDAESADFVLECGFAEICGIDGTNIDAFVDLVGVSGERECAARVAVDALPGADVGLYEICVRFFYTYVDFFGHVEDDDTRGFIDVSVLGN